MKAELYLILLESVYTPKLTLFVSEWLIIDF